MPEDLLADAQLTVDLVGLRGAISDRGKGARIDRGYGEYERELLLKDCGKRGAFG